MSIEPETLEVVGPMFERGLSFTAMAEAVGLSRSFLYDQLRRLGYEREVVSPSFAPATYYGPPPDHYARQPITMTGAIKGSAPRHWLKRESGQCKWPIGEGMDVDSCCAPTADPRSAYCEGHRAISLKSHEREAA